CGSDHYDSDYDFDYDLNDCNADASGTTGKTGSVQSFKPPEVNTCYKIEAWGANGGQSTKGATGGKGAYKMAYFNLTETLKIVVGKSGTNSGSDHSNNGGGGGGGGTFVYITRSSNSHQLLMAAGGGGGGGDGSSSYSGKDGSDGTSSTCSGSTVGQG
uniref:receptor protein-tyrosine kinase n=1 Tax=Macrostomum lignano TaxID=282301 RepID=A0A1I8J935_9PLAT